MNLPEYMLPTEGFNLPLARKVLEYAEHEHDDFKFDMGDWYEKIYELNKAGKQICKTSACLAGTAAFLAPNAEIDECNGICVDNENYGYEEGGMILLGIGLVTAKILFYADDDDALSLLRQMVEYAERQP